MARYPKADDSVQEENSFAVPSSKALKKGQAVPKKEPGRMGFIRSSLRNPVTISYGGEGLLVHPQGRIDEVDKEQLGALPVGVKFIAYGDKKEE